MPRVGGTHIPGLNGMDEVWVPSLFNARTFEGGGVDPHRIKVTAASRALQSVLITGLR